MLQAFIRRRRIKAAPQSSLSELDGLGGLVRIRGQARGPVHNSPISNRPCVYSRVVLHEWFNGSKKPLLTHDSSASFGLEEAGAQCIVDCFGASLELLGQPKRGHNSECPTEVRNILKSNGIPILDEYGEGRSIEFREWIIQDAQTISVAGIFAQGASHDGGPFRSSNEPARIAGSDKFPLAIFTEE